MSQFTNQIFTNEDYQNFRFNNEYAIERNFSNEPVAPGLFSTINAFAPLTVLIDEDLVMYLDVDLDYLMSGNMPVQRYSATTGYT